MKRCFLAKKMMRNRLSFFSIQINIFDVICSNSYQNLFLLQHQQAQQQTIQTTPAKSRLADASTPKQQNRTPTLLPQNSAQQTIRPASSVSTQTAQNQALLGSNKGKMRGKPQAVRPAVPANMKNDASNQTKTIAATPPTIQQMVTSAGNK